MLYDYVEVAPFTYVLYHKETGEKLNMHEKMKELEAQGKFDGKK
jgi:hypothetical protein